jgi:hypothetical protein
METVIESMEIPKELYKELKLISLQQKTSVAEIIIEGAREQVAKYKAAREHVKEHCNKYRSVREQVKEQVDKYNFSEIHSSREKLTE